MYYNIYMSRGSIQYRSYRFSIYRYHGHFPECFCGVKLCARQGKEVGELTEGIAKLAKRRLDCTWLTSRDDVVVLS